MCVCLVTIISQTVCYAMLSYCIVLRKFDELGCMCFDAHFPLLVLLWCYFIHVFNWLSNKPTFFTGKGGVIYDRVDIQPPDKEEDHMIYDKSYVLYPVIAPSGRLLLLSFIYFFSSLYATWHTRSILN